MAGGKRFKFQGSTIQFATAFSGSTAITAVTQADPAVVTAAAHGLEDGDIVKIDGIVGMTELNDEVFVVEVLSASTFSLLGVNSTDYGAWTSGGTIAAATMSAMCELTGYNRQGGASPEIEGNSVCSEEAEFEVGLPDRGTTQIDYNFAPRTAVQQAMETFYRSGEKTGTKVTLPKQGGIMVQLGFVQQTSERASNNTLWTGSMTLRNTGARRDFEAA